MKVAVYTIALNEEHNVEGWAESCKDADVRLIADTGSDDDTLEATTDNGVTRASLYVHPWRFDDARNAALALLPMSIDYCISLDMDERLQPGWREALEQAHAAGISRPRYRYVWSWKPAPLEVHHAGTRPEDLHLVPDVVFARDHIHTRQGYRWVHPVHECLVPFGPSPETTAVIEGLEVHHHPDTSKDRGFYLPLLEQAVKEAPDNDRNVFYFARELLFNGAWEESAYWFNKHLELSKWAPERAASMRFLAQIYPTAAEEYLLKACAEAPGYREPILDLIRLHLTRGRGMLAQGLALRALEIDTRQLEYLTESAAWDGTLEQLAGVSVEGVEFKAD